MAPGGRLLIAGHDRDNLTEGVGGPSDPELLLTVEAVTADLAGTGLRLRRAEQVTRTVEDGQATPRRAVDCLVRAHRPAAAGG